MHIFPSMCISYTSDNPVTYHRPVWITHVTMFSPPNLLLMTAGGGKKYITLSLIFSIG